MAGRADFTMGQRASFQQSCRLRRAAVCAGAILLICAPAAARDDGACRFPEIARGVATAATDARSIRLADGREVTLAGLAFLQADTSQDRDVRNAVETMVRGQAVTLRGPSAEPDRYGRLAAFVFVNASETPVQYSLLERGMAQAEGASGLGESCRAALLRRELAARGARLGLFADPRYAILAPDDADLHTRPGRFAVIEGKVVSVRQTSATTYINFGRRWSETLSVAIPRGHVPSFAEAGLEPMQLDGRVLRVRGYVEARSGPVIEATAPGQIEIVRN
jgi:hypothetical protein